MKYLILSLLKIYKKYLSSGSHCRYYPTCSVYMYQSVEKYGVLRGVWMGIKRLVSCHPWSKGGVDMVD